MINKFFLLITMLLFMTSSCSAYSSDKTYYAGKIRREVANKLAKKYSMQPNCFGGSMLDKITMLSIGFEIYRPLSQEEARSIIVDSVEEFTRAVNNDPNIQEFLEKKPFGPENIVIDIIIFDEDGTKLYHPNLSLVVSSIGTVMYKTNDPKKEFGRKLIITETFDEAKQLIEEEN